ncbi:MAG TPA: cysteine desulfurase, partial [candidate division Zixibacteria bacterium]|nr:cysteine desulfurase [candidate division Zixibacteria bacterium]
MAERFVYFDNINTTFPDSAVIEVLNEALTSRAGNPSSHIHSAGISAARILDQARGQVASLIGADASSIIFTSGSTEANNLAISGFIKANQNHQLVVSSIEHFSILNQANRLKRNGQKVTFLDVDQGG